MVVVVGQNSRPGDMQEHSLAEYMVVHTLALEVVVVGSMVVVVVVVVSN